MKCLFLLIACAACSSPAPVATPVSAPAPVAAPPAPKPAAPPKKDNEKTVLDIALGSPDHTTLVAAVKAAGKADALGSPGGIYTVFAPTNAAFDALPKGTVESLLTPEKKADLVRLVQHHAAVPILEEKDIVDGAKLAMSDGSSVTFHVTGDQRMVDNAHIVGAVRGMNGIVYVVDAVLIPPAK